MATRERRIDDANRRAGRLRADLGRELRDARLAAGLSQAAVAAAARLSTAQLSRMERALLPHIAPEDLVCVAAILGLELSVRVFSAGDPIRDSAHLELLDRLHRRLPESLRWRAEVPLPLLGDRRAKDAVIRGRDFSVGVEAETRLRDVQAIVRRLAPKQRDGGLEHAVLLGSDTRHNREVLALSRDVLSAALPDDTRGLLLRLGAGADPGASGIIVH